VFAQPFTVYVTNKLGDVATLKIFPRDGTQVAPITLNSGVEDFPVRLSFAGNCTLASFDSRGNKFTAGKVINLRNYADKTINLIGDVEPQLQTVRMATGTGGTYLQQVQVNVVKEMEFESPSDGGSIATLKANQQQSQQQQQRRRIFRRQ
jgi:hypothetical protein